MKNTLCALAMLMSISATSQTANRYDVVIHEIMANPSNVTSLPNLKYIELYNRSAEAVNLNGWTISDGNNTARISRSFEILPDSFVIICPNNAAGTWAAYGTSIGVSNFPTLRVNGDLLVLKSAQQQTIHAVSYERSWYNNDVKAASGWSLEMIDAQYPCIGKNNWTASTHTQGGTPGSPNSTKGFLSAQQHPRVLGAVITDSVSITVRFNQQMDSSNAANTNYYQCNGNTIVNAQTMPPLFTEVQLQVQQPLQNNQVYTLSFTDNITNCSGSSLQNESTVKTGIASLQEPMDMVINEVLFNPFPDGVEYIELLNRGQKIGNLKQLYISNRTSAGNLGTLRLLAETDRLIFPGDYVVLTENPSIVQQQYIVQDSATLQEMKTMPSMPNAGGTLVLLNQAGNILDELTYSEKWHFPLITSPKGVALERTDPAAVTQNADNWHSAATSAGFGTPGYKNSQYHAPVTVKGSINIQPKTFSPDNDGVDDYTTIQYQFEETGNICSISIFDAQGRPVRKLVQSALCSREGYFRWDGLGENNLVLKTGVYILFIEVFNLEGKMMKDKKAVTLARRL